MAKILLSLLLCTFLMNCSDLTSSNRKHIDLPTEFRLIHGSALVYESVYEYQDTTVLDTLYISKLFQDYYGYSWKPNEYWYLVNNYGGMFLFHGIIRYNIQSDTLLFSKPYIWAFFKEDTGFVDYTKFSDYRINADRIHLSIHNDIKAFGNYYDGIVKTKIDSTSETVLLNTVITKSGYYQFTEFFELTGNVIRQITMKKMMFSHPPEPPQKTNKYLKKGSIKEQENLSYISPWPSFNKDVLEIFP